MDSAKNHKNLRQHETSLENNVQTIVKSTQQVHLAYQDLTAAVTSHQAKPPSKPKSVFKVIK